MAYLALFVCLLGAAILLVYAAGNMPPATLARILRFVGGGLLSLVTLFLAVTGRLGLAIPAGIAALALFRGDIGSLGGFARSIPGMGRKSAGQRSDVETEWLSMWLDHDSGAMGGRVRKGRFAGAELEHLSREDLDDLRGEIAADEESVRLLDAYIDRTLGGEAGTGAEAGDGRAGDGHAGTSSGGSSGSGRGRGARHGGAMTREDALEVLGLGPDATDADIRAAHRELMQKVHPDRGGSSYLAAQLNQAKDILLKG